MFEGSILFSASMTLLFSNKHEYLPIIPCSLSFYQLDLLFKKKKWIDIFFMLSLPRGPKNTTLNLIMVQMLSYVAGYR